MFSLLSEPRHAATMGTVQAFPPPPALSCSTAPTPLRSFEAPGMVQPRCASSGVALPR